MPNDTMIYKADRRAFVLQVGGFVIASLSIKVFEQEEAASTIPNRLAVLIGQWPTTTAIDATRER